MMTRGQRNNNPGNVRKSKDKWQGCNCPQSDSDFVTFESPAWGIRTIARILIRYADAYELVTPKRIIGRWAPPSENSTKDYVAFVCSHTGWKPEQIVDMQKYEDCRAMVEAIIWFENGSQPYPSTVIDEGLRLAGVVKPVSPSAVASAAKDPKVIAATVVGTATAAQQVIGSISGVWDSINSAGIDPRMIMGAAGLCAAAFCVWFIYEWITLRKAGIK